MGERSRLQLQGLDLRGEPIVHVGGTGGAAGPQDGAQFCGVDGEAYLHAVVYLCVEAVVEDGEAVVEGVGILTVDDTAEPPFGFSDFDACGNVVSLAALHEAELNHAGAVCLDFSAEDNVYSHFFMSKGKT